MRAVIFALLSLLFLPSCALPDGGQASLPAETIVIETASGAVRFQVEIAATAEARNRGLMYRKNMAADAGMLFIYERPQIATFWMRNTYIPLDMIFVRENGIISSIAPAVRTLSDARTSSAEPVLAVLEINAGRAAALGIKRGDRVRAPAFRNVVP